jgi:hypothetical protein
VNSNPDPDLERAKLQLDRERFEHDKELARERFDHEQQLDKSKTSEEKRRTWLTAGSIFIPLLIAALTFANASFTQDRQAEDQLALQAQQAQAEFELKAADIVMASDSAAGTYNKARAMRALFPNRLPLDFADSFNPSDFTSSNEAGVVQSKKELLNLLADHPSERQQIIDTWKYLFPDDEWVKDLE